MRSGLCALSLFVTSALALFALLCRPTMCWEGFGTCHWFSESGEMVCENPRISSSNGKLPPVYSTVGFSFRSSASIPFRFTLSVLTFTITVYLIASGDNLQVSSRFKRL